MSIKQGTKTIASAVPSTTWGSIEGILTDQVDLSNALQSKVGSYSPVLTGIPQAPKAAVGTNTNQIATTSFVKTAIDNINTLPSQTDQSGKFLTTNGTEASWIDVYPSQSGQSGKFLTTNGTTTSWVRGIKNSATYYENSIIINSTSTSADRSIIMGLYSEGTNDSVVIGYNAKATGQYHTAIGSGSGGTGDYGISIGDGSHANAKGAIAIGGTNSNEGTLSVSLYQGGISFTNYELLQQNGKIPVARIPDLSSTYAADSNVVHKTGNETISGTKTFENVFITKDGWSLHLKNPNIQKTVAPSENHVSTISFEDKDGVGYGVVEGTKYTDNNLGVQLNVQDANNQWHWFGIACNQTGDSWANADNGIKSSIIGWGMPSDKYIDLTLGASGATYTAPANGWYTYYDTAGGVGLTRFINVTNGLTNATNAPNANWSRGCSIPVKKGDTVSFTYENRGNNFVFRFIYAEGEN